MTTGMTKAERWYEVARRVENGGLFSAAEWDVFGGFALDTAEFNTAFCGRDLEGKAEYINCFTMLALFLAYEAEDEENERLLIQHLIDANPEPVTMVAAEEPVSGFWEDAPEERRSSWNAKLADGMRKWADWVEARF